MCVGLQIITMAKMILGWMMTGDGQHETFLPTTVSPTQIAETIP